MTTNCECSDPGCPYCAGECKDAATTVVRRIDMEDGTTTFEFCDSCADDALESGVFAAEDTDDEAEEFQPEESDAYITDRPFRGYDVSFDGKFIGNFNERDDAEAAIRAEMEKHQFWPNVWFVSDHGNLDLVTV